VIEYLRLPENREDWRCVVELNGVELNLEIESDRIEIAPKRNPDAHLGAEEA